MLAERVGFEPTLRCRKPDFESGAIDHSATSPVWIEADDYIQSAIYQMRVGALPQSLSFPTDILAPAPVESSPSPKGVPIELPVSVHELFKKSLLLAATTWQGRLDGARTEPEIVMIAREFTATLEPREVAMLPARCQPGKFFDANDVTGYAFVLINSECADESESARLVKRLSIFFSAASIRLAQILSVHPANAQDSRRSAA
jgi:hypothetical protein